jgi:FAD:protein FMN transferase
MSFIPLGERRIECDNWGVDLRRGKKAVCLASLCFILLSCSSSKTLSDETYACCARILCQAETKEESELKEILSCFDEVGEISDSYYPHNGVIGVYDVNNAISPITISEDLYDLLSFSLQMEEITEGYFSPLCFGLSSLWKNSLDSDAPSLPDDSSIEKEVAKIKNTTLVLENEKGIYTAYLRQKDPSIGRALIDLGGIAKGYAARKAKKKAESLGWTNYYINAGSSTLVLGEANKNDGYYSLSWDKDLEGKQMKAKNTCVSTSSTSVQGVKISGKIYSHIVNPFSGEASPNITGVTLLGEDPALLDAFSTAFMWMGEEKRNSLIEEYRIQAIFYKDGAVLYDNAGLLGV